MGLVLKEGFFVGEITTPTVFCRPRGMATMWPFFRGVGEK